MLLVQAQAYRQEYGMNAIYLLPVNLYGPGDNFDPETSHVIPALIRKCLEAVEGEVVVWGSQASREFCMWRMRRRRLRVAACYDDAEPVNLGSGRELSIKELVELIAELTGFKGRLVWDTTKPDGQPRRCLETTRAEQAFGFQARTNFREGLQRTITWYRQRRTLGT